MSTRKRRARTGCLTCRARRVKCDEAKPQCGRCISANVACAGYQPQRVVISVKAATRGRRQPGETRLPISTCGPSPAEKPMVLNKEDTASSPLLRLDRHTQSAVQFFPEDHPSPVIPLLSCPRADQSLHPGARHVLGYHQVLMRTIPILFPAQHLPFWRDVLLQEAWGHHYLYLTLVALGNSHRAALMTVSENEDDRANGLDMKIAAVQLYTHALQDLSKSLDEAKNDPALLVAGLCLMAYFESLNGNIPAFIGRVQTARHYYSTLLACSPSRSDRQIRTRHLAPLRDCLQSLSYTCYVTLPLGMIRTITGQPLDKVGTLDIEQGSRNALNPLESLVALATESKDIEELIWSPIAAYSRNISVASIGDFEHKLTRWKDEYLEIIPELDTDAALDVLLVYRWSQFAIPPTPYPSATQARSLTVAYYNFYKARLKWALILMGEDEPRNQMMAEFYFYEALRHVASRIVSMKAKDEAAYIPCETLKMGLLPILHIIGLCSPQPSWLHLVETLCDQIAQEGVLKGHTFATNLHCLHEFETHGPGGHELGDLDRYPAPSDRIICQLIPETDGSHFTSFFAMPVPAGDDPRPRYLRAFRVIGHARWRCGYAEQPCTPVFETYHDQDSARLESFSTEWLYATPPARDWLAWSQQKEFHLDHALQDHISGTRLLLAVDGAPALGEGDTWMPNQTRSPH